MNATSAISSSRKNSLFPPAADLAAGVFFAAFFRGDEDFREVDPAADLAVDLAADFFFAREEVRFTVDREDVPDAFRPASDPAETSFLLLDLIEFPMSRRAGYSTKRRIRTTRRVGNPKVRARGPDPSWIPPWPGRKQRILPPHRREATSPGAMTSPP